MMLPLRHALSLNVEPCMHMCPPSLALPHLPGGKPSIPDIETSTHVKLVDKWLSLFQKTLQQQEISRRKQPLLHCLRVLARSSLVSASADFTKASEMYSSSRYRSKENESQHRDDYYETWSRLRKTLTKTEKTLRDFKIFVSHNFRILRMM
jgi:hypothetical protein